LQLAADNVRFMVAFQQEPTYHAVHVPPVGTGLSHALTNWLNDSSKFTKCKSKSIMSKDFCCGGIREGMLEADNVIDVLNQNFEQLADML
jgi:hypothetical protein